jgi:transcriptional regulator with XRE-family HTH domain
VVKIPNLKALRQRALLTQRELAEKSGVTMVTIARAETGHDVQFSTVKKLGEALGVNPRELLAGEESREAA